MTTTETQKPKTYGFRIDRSGAVFAFTAQARHGRCPQHSQLHAGFVWREGRDWRNDQCCDRFPTQEKAARMLMAIIFGGES